MIRKRLMLFSVFLLLIWAIGNFVLHNTLSGYLHLFLLLSVNAALLCFFIESKQQSAPANTSETSPPCATPAQTTRIARTTRRDGFASGETASMKSVGGIS